jgi:hypothetical protein
LVELRPWSSHSFIHVQSIFQLYHILQAHVSSTSAILILIEKTNLQEPILFPQIFDLLLQSGGFAFEMCNLTLDLADMGLAFGSKSSGFIISASFLGLRVIDKRLTGQCVSRAFVFRIGFCAGRLSAAVFVGATATLICWGNILESVIKDPGRHTF